MHSDGPKALQESQMPLRRLPAEAPASNARQDSCRLRRPPAHHFACLDSAVSLWSSNWRRIVLTRFPPASPSQGRPALWSHGIASAHSLSVQWRRQLLPWSCVPVPPLRSAPGPVPGHKPALALRTLQGFVRPGSIRWTMSRSGRSSTSRKLAFLVVTLNLGKPGPTWDLESYGDHATAGSKHRNYGAKAAVVQSSLLTNCAESCSKYPPCQLQSTRSLAIRNISHFCSFAAQPDSHFDSTHPRLRFFPCTRPARIIEFSRISSAGPPRN